MLIRGNTVSQLKVIPGVCPGSALLYACIRHMPWRRVTFRAKGFARNFCVLIEWIMEGDDNDRHNFDVIIDERDDL